MRCVRSAEISSKFARRYVRSRGEVNVRCGIFGFGRERTGEVRRWFPEAAQSNGRTGGTAGIALRPPILHRIRKKFTIPRLSVKVRILILTSRAEFLILPLRLSNFVTVWLV